MSKTPVTIPITPRLQQCLDAGGVIALFPVLSRWSRDELVALTVDIAAYCEAASTALKATWEASVFLPENFLVARNSKAIDHAHDEAQQTLLAVTSEIYSVALYYLDTGKRKDA